MKYFTKEETQCGCGCGFDLIDEFKLLLDHARDLAEIPFVINSGARCKDHNRAIGGKDTSSHTLGIAVDIRATGSRERYIVMNSFAKIGVTRFGIDKGFVHIDIDREKDQQVAWLY